MHEDLIVWDAEKKEWTGKGDQPTSEAELKCLRDLPPILRICASCDDLHSCGLGLKLTGISGDELSITEKVLKYDWTPTDTKELQTWTLEQLQEFNSACDERDRREAVREMNKTDTIIRWNPEKKEWVTGHVGIDTDPNGVHCWDPVKKRWFVKK